jgi:hypothetical protein
LIWSGDNKSRKPLICGDLVFFDTPGCRDDKIRTCDLFVPNEAPYRAGLHPELNYHKINDLTSLILPLFEIPDMLSILGLQYPVTMKKNRPATILKKFFKIFFIALIVLIGSAFAAPYLFKGKIIALIKKEINENIDAKADFKDVNISFFRSFPKVSVGIENLQIVGNNEFASDTLISARQINAALDIMSVIKGAEYKPVHNPGAAQEQPSKEGGYISVRKQKVLESGRWDNVRTNFLRI